jgi:hypothetical protein
MHPMFLRLTHIAECGSDGRSFLLDSIIRPSQGNGSTMMIIAVDAAVAHAQLFRNTERPSFRAKPFFAVGYFGR